MTLRLVVPEMLSPGGPHLNAILLEWCAVRLGDGASFPIGTVAVGIANGETYEDLLAVAVFENFRRSPNGVPLNIDCSIAASSPRWMTRGTIRAILHYPFCQLGVQRLTAQVKEKNLRSRKMLKGLGFKEEGFIRDALEDGSGVFITGMLRDEAKRWLGDMI